MASVPLETGAIVMATGIVAIGLGRIHVDSLSLPLVAIAACIWLVLLASLGLQAAEGLAELMVKLRAPAAVALVAGTAVLGTRLQALGWLVPGAVLLGLAVVFMALLLGPVLGHWQTPNHGASFLLAVAVAALAALAAELSVRAHAAWLLVAAGVLWGLALVAYLFVLANFDFRDVLHGRGDHWVAGGALAIAMLVGDEFCLGLRSLHHAYAGAPEVAAIAIWAAASGWILVLLLGELAHPRLAYHHLRWATVFPLGMYGVGTLTLGRLCHTAALLALGGTFIWIGFAAWVAGAAALLLAQSGRIRAVVVDGASTR